MRGNEPEYLLGFDIGGTKCAVVVGKTSGETVEILDRRAFPTETPRGPDNALGLMEQAARELVASLGLRMDDVRSAGISCGGPLDSDKGIVLGPPNLPGWDYVPIVERLQTNLGIPAKLRNDADACALAEWKWGAGRGSRHMVFMTFGTGIGAGMILGGRLHTGASGLAGEVGHIRLAEDGPLGYGKRGSFEGFCSGGGIADLARTIARERWERGQTVGFCESRGCLETVSAQSVAEAALAGDEAAREVFAVSARRLGQGLSILIDILNPEVIVIGGIFMRQRDLLWPLAEQVIRAEALPGSADACRVVPAELGERIGDYACLSVAAE